VVRHGTCKLRIFINSDEYSLKRLAPSLLKGSRLWQLRKLTGERAGSVYHVGRAQGTISCTCPDASKNQALCKHQKALVALGIISGRKEKAKEVVHVETA
jgi:hypothetical protein